MNTLDIDKESLLEKSILPPNFEENNETSNENDVEQTNKQMNANLSKAELVEHLKKLLQLPKIDKNEVDAIKQAFYKKHKAEQYEILKKHIEDGGEKETFVPQPDKCETELKQLLTDFRTKRMEENQNSQKEKENNLIAKQKMLEELKSLTENLDTIENINNSILAVRKLQQEWKNIGLVAPEKANEIWKNYQLYIERFYDYIKISNDLREYDLKKNLEVKTAICEQTEKLAEEKEIVPAFRELQQLHEEWRETGPVSHELREELWDRFKNASSIINKKYQAFFDEVKQTEENNFTQKTAICEQIEAIDYTQIINYKLWEDKTKEIIELQNKWKQIGYAPKKVNVKVYDRFRKVCDEFFKQKNEYFQHIKDELGTNLTKKIALCEQAEALKETTEWKETSDKLIKIQKEWKSIGAVPRKQSDLLWKRFIDACDYFFEQKEKQTSEEKNTQTQNLALKKEIISKIQGLELGNDAAEITKQLRELIAQWNNVGHVPFKDKDKIFKAFKKATDEQFDKLHVDESNRRLHSFRTNIEDGGDKSPHKLYREREKLMKEFEHLKNQIATYENNIGFFSSSKKADGMRKEMEKRIENLKEEKELIISKIQLIDANL
jgi:hypothetical protein